VRRGRKTPVLDRLDSEQAAGVLRRLLVAHPEIVSETEEISRSLLREAAYAAIADEVEEAVKALDIGDLNARAGAHEWGYVEPSEAAWEILEEAVEPFIADIERCISLGLEDAALQMCQGVVLGLYRAERGKGGELAQWAPDFFAEAAGGAINAWRTGSRTGTTAGGAARRNRGRFPDEFSSRFLPEWRDMIQRILSRTDG